MLGPAGVHTTEVTSDRASLHGFSPGKVGECAAIAVRIGLALIEGEVAAGVLLSAGKLLESRHGGV